MEQGSKYIQFMSTCGIPHVTRNSKEMPETTVVTSRITFDANGQVTGRVVNQVTTNTRKTPEEEAAVVNAAAKKAAAEKAAAEKAAEKAKNKAESTTSVMQVTLCVRVFLMAIHDWKEVDDLKFCGVVLSFCAALYAGYTHKVGNITRIGTFFMASMMALVWVTVQYYVAEQLVVQAPILVLLWGYTITAWQLKGKHADLLWTATFLYTSRVVLIELMPDASTGRGCLQLFAQLWAVKTLPSMVEDPTAAPKLLPLLLGFFYTFPLHGIFF